MKYRVYLADSCKELATKYSYLPQVEKLANNIETTQSISNWENYSIPYIKRKLGTTYRIIAIKKILQENIIICFLAIFPRGSAEYNGFLNNPANLDNLQPTEEILKGSLNNDGDYIPPVLEPTAIEYGYLYDRLPRLDNSDGIIYESKEWVEKVQKSTILAWYYDLIIGIVEDKNDQQIVAQKQQAKILYRNFPDQKRIFLISPILHTTEENELRNKYKAIFATNPITDEELLKLSGRAYPTFIVADYDIWANVQTNAEANLALSPQETEILDSVAHPEDSTKKAYPLFINGRPGSGKSTILQYLFAEHLYLHLGRQKTERLMHPPIYLTYSEKLLQNAKKLVQSLILCNPAMKVQGDLINKEELKEISDDCFCVFHKFLHGLLPTNQKTLFKEDKRIDFPEFRKLWNDYKRMNPTADIRNLNPELVWHVIRTYIKGMCYDSNNYLTPEDYEELPNKKQTVESGIFRIIYEKVWGNWYKNYCSEHKYWDNQDLSQTLLNSSQVELSVFPAVFCDEAQDFTKNELLLILRLSLFSRRKIFRELQRIPFAFAGDPYQTLNPTGFDWSSMQAGFHETIVQGLDKTLQASLEFNYKELSYNYRSSRNIVTLCNVIQLLRGIIFGIEDIRPQQTWFEEDSPIPSFFDIDDAVTRQKLEEESGLVIILPCQEGEEPFYIQEDDLLQNIVQNNNDIRNFLSSMSAKGLEFSQVILYKFGDDYVKNYGSLLDPLTNSTPHSSQNGNSLPLEYFMNRIYVAASRPKKRLLIIDTKEGIEKFWTRREFQNPTNLLSLYKNATPNGWREKDLSWVQLGTWGTRVEDEPDEPVTLAKLFLEEGISKKDPYKLHLAEANFKRANRNRDAQECKAKRLEIEQDYESAGKEYLFLNDANNALRCFWLKGCYKNIIDSPLFNNTIEQRAADFMEKGRDFARCKLFIQFLLQEVQGFGKEKILADEHWGQICNILVSRLSRSELQQQDGEWKHLYSSLKLLKNLGLDITNTSELAEIAFRADELKEALAIWEQCTPVPINKDSYRKAKGYTEKFPQNLQWLIGIGDFQKIIDDYESHKHHKLSPELSKLIADAYCKKNKYEEVIDLLGNIVTEDSFEKFILQELGKQGIDPQILVSVNCRLIKIKVELRKWKESIELITNLTKSGIFFEEDILKLKSALLYELALSDELVEASFDDKSPINTYLKDLFVNVSWDMKFNLKLVGTVIEKVCYFGDIFKFYGDLWALPLRPDEILFSKERWLLTKYRNALYVKRKNDMAEYTRIQEEITKHKSLWKIELDLNELFPKITLVDNLLQKVEASYSKIDEAKRTAIKMLYTGSMSSEMIAAAVSIPIYEVEKVIAELIPEQK